MSENTELDEQRTEILETLRKIVNEETGIAVEEIQMEKSFTEDLDVDSLSMMTIVVNLEEELGVRVTDDAVKDLKTVKDAVEYIKKAQAEKA